MKRRNQLFQNIKQKQRLSTKTILVLTASSAFVFIALFMTLPGLFVNTTVSGATIGDYRTVASGNWSAAATWERYDGSAWVAAASTPTNTDGAITIRANHTVTITTGVGVDEVVVDSAGAITVNSGVTLTLRNGTGTDCSVNGTLKSAGTITISAGASLAFNNGGKYQHNYTTTAGTIPTATWSTGSECEIIGYTTNTSTPSGLQSFYHFTWNCPSQTGIISLNGGLTTVNGDFKMVTTGTKELRMGSTGVTMNIAGSFIQKGGIFISSINSGQTSTLNIGGDCAIQAGTCYMVKGNGSTGNFNVSGNWSHTGGTLTVNGNPGTNGQVYFAKTGTQTFSASGNTVTGNVNYTVNATSLLDLGTSSVLGNNFTVTSGATLSIGSANGITASGATGNVQVTGTRTFSTSGKYIYNGGSAQVTGNGLPATVQDLTLNNSYGLTLTGTTTVSNILTLNSGKITTNSNELILSSATAGAMTGYSSVNYIIGNLRRAVTGSMTVDFPVGTSANSELLTIALNSTTGVSNIAASFTNANPVTVSQPLNGVSVNGTAIVDMLDYGYWSLTPDASLLTGNYTVTVNSTGHTNAASMASAYSVLARTDVSAPWQSVGDHSANTQSINGGVVTAVRSGLTSFYNFGIGFASGALPVELLSFTAVISGDHVNLKWATASEKDNDFFTVERSADGYHFENIYSCKGAGNSSVIRNYSAVDPSPVSGKSYYRLRQTDFNGTTTTSDIKVVSFKGAIQNGVSVSTVYPTQFTDHLIVEYTAMGEGTAQFLLVNVSGGVVANEKMKMEKGSNSFVFEDNNHLPPGIYFVTVLSGDQKTTRKVVKL